MDGSTEDNYPRDAFEELWGGEGVIRGHTFSSKLKEQPQAQFQRNVTWWPERFYNFEFNSFILNQVFLVFSDKNFFRLKIVS